MNLHVDTAIDAVLGRLETDLAQDRNVLDLPEDLARAMLAHLSRSEDFDVDIEGPVTL
jgi:hypothetical protein